MALSGFALNGSLSIHRLFNGWPQSLLLTFIFLLLDIVKKHRLSTCLLLTYMLYQIHDILILWNQISHKQTFCNARDCRIAI